ncbi:MAG: hypothetical protein H6707_15615 [Deltaproteobacteria bacterium]|nr:hypothetical protein [Deltaproteobacteria bacterium]
MTYGRSKRGALQPNIDDVIATLEQALALAQLPSAREQYRQQLDGAIDRARCELAQAGAEGTDSRSISRLRSILVRGLVAHAENARYGAGQLSRGAQRAPTRADCDDGWRRVAEIVAVAEASAAEVSSIISGFEDYRARKAAAQARAAAHAARRILEERNHAYTFHTDPRFSFGEGWYLAAAAALCDDVLIQIEPEQPQTVAAQCFLHAAGLDDRLVPYRPRPRANKHLPEIVARAFGRDVEWAQERLRAAFLGDEPVAPSVVEWTARRLASAAPGPKVLLWVRRGSHQPSRNTPHCELVELARCAHHAGLVPLLFGDAVGDDLSSVAALDLTLCWQEPLFQGRQMRRSQLQLFEQLRRAHRLVGQLGVTTAGMDGPALLGLPTMYLTDSPNVRLGKWVGAVPGYEEVLRGEDYLERISARLKQWALGDRRAEAAASSIDA